MERIIELTRQRGYGLLKNHVTRAIIITILLIMVALLANAKDNFNAYYIEPIENCIFLAFLGTIIPTTKNRYIRLFELAFVIAIATYFTYLEFEMWQGNNLSIPFDGEEMMKKRQWINWGLIFILFLTGIALFKRPWMGIFTVSTVFTAIGFISYMVLQFRGETLLPSDIGALQTAMEVVESYQLKVYSNVFAALFCYITILIWTLRLRTKTSGWEERTVNSARMISALVVLTSIWLFNTLPFEKYFYPWFIPNNGYVYSVMINLKMLNVKPDSSYSVEGVAKTLEGSEGGSIIGNYNPQKSMAKTFKGAKKPNIVCIMNESFSDLSVLGDYKTDKAVLPNWNKLKKESISGNLVVEVFGGGTSDSEYSFLTGNSTVLFADNARAYELYIKDDASALPKKLKDQGYTTTAVHADKPENWNRRNVYPKLGFDDFQTLETFPNAEIVRDSYISDKETFKRIEDIFENKGDDPAFIFDVTIQNHGAYGQSYNNLEEIKLEEPVGDYPQAEQYLSLIRKSDKAFGELIDYFRKVDEPTVVLMFGDHMPKIEDEFYTKLLGGELDELDLEKQRDRYTTPFMIWANYDIPHKSIDEMSINYLSTLLTEVTGTEKTQYNRYLEELYSEFPVIDRKGVVTKSGEDLAYSELEGEAEQKLNMYKNIIYNNVLGKDNKQAQYFN